MNLDLPSCVQTFPLDPIHCVLLKEIEQLKKKFDLNISEQLNTSQNNRVKNLKFIFQNN